MNNRSHFPLLAIVAVACAAGWLARNALIAQEKVAPAPIAKWEHKILDEFELGVIGNPDLEQNYDPDLSLKAQEMGLDKLSAENWELITVQTGGFGKFWYFFKRPKAG